MLAAWLIGISLLGIAEGAAAAPDGANLFARHCGACHGADGKGGVGIPLALPSFLRAVSNGYLERSIRNGRPGRVMPAFPSLSSAEVVAIVRHIRDWGGDGVPSDDMRPVPGDTRRGRELFATHCAECHGPSGQGGRGTGKSFSRPRELPIVPPALQNPGFLHSASDRLIRQTIVDGREGTPMPGFGDRLNGRQVDDLTAFVRSLEPASPHVDQPGTPLTLSVESPYGLHETVENVRNAAIAANFAVIRSDHQEHGLVPEGSENSDRVFVDFCNFQSLYDALQIDPRVGMFLPCRISVVASEGRVRIMTVNPALLSRVFNNAELDAACQQMTQTYLQILDEAVM